MPPKKPVSPRREECFLRRNPSHTPGMDPVSLLVAMKGTVYFNGLIYEEYLDEVAGYG